ncbi:hypothetical protein RV12_GL001099 [Enterococcus quebecensis]|nr:hypothetical protein RV12_GL001099 [Enterococcus quebecensis]
MLGFTRGDDEQYLANEVREVILTSELLNAMIRTKRNDQ